MSIPADLDAFLCGAPTDAMREVCLRLLTEWREPIRSLSKAASWMAYRALESREAEEIVKAREWVARALAEQSREEEEFWRLRWECSLSMALSYLQVANGEDARPTWRAMFNLNWIPGNAPAGVNVCRAQVLLAAAESQAGNFRGAEQAVKRGYDAFALAAAHWPLRAHVSNGEELVRAARAISILIALLPHCRLPFRGPAMRADRILQIDQLEPFRSALRMVLPRSCTVVRKREDFDALLDGCKTGAELGVAQGAFSEILLKRTGLKLMCVDKWNDAGHPEEQMNEAAQRLSRFGDRTQIVRASFSEAVERVADESLDFIYVDGYAHTGQESGQTLREWYPKLKRGGIFAGHDYHSDWPLTVQEVDRFSLEVGRPIFLTSDDRYPSWYLFK